MEKQLSAWGFKIEINFTPSEVLSSHDEHKQVFLLRQEAFLMKLLISTIRLFFNVTYFHSGVHLLTFESSRSEKRV